MSMKWKTITFLLLLFGFSSNAYANYTIYPFCSGSVFPSDPSRDHSLLHGCLAGDGITYSRYANSYAFYGVLGGRENRYTFTVSGGSCPDGQFPNPNTYVCEAPEPCDVGYIRNEVGLCVLDPQDDFCDSSDFTDLLMQETESCAARYPDHFTNLVPSCTDRENYSFDCQQGFPKPTDPTSPIDPPSGGFGGGSTPPANPNTTEFDKPEPDEVTPNESTDTAVLEAVRNLNRDNNQALKGINDDLNVGLDKLDGQLTKLNETNKEIGDKLVEQTEQDHAIYEANKLLAQQQTGAIAKVGDDLGRKLDFQTKSLTNSLAELDPDSHTLSTAGCTTFSCNGDAITCYIARQSWKNKCAEDENYEDFQLNSGALLDDMKTVSEDSVDSEGAFKGVFADAETTADEALDAYTSSNGFSFNGGCPSPRTYSVLGTPWTIDYAAFCQLALVFRFFIMASAALSSFFMIAKYI